MTIYIIQIILVVLLGIALKPLEKQKDKKIFCSICFTILLIVSGFRDESIGADTPIYTSVFGNATFLDPQDIYMERGFIFYLKAIRFLSDNYTFFLLVSSTICIGALSIFVYYFSKDPTMSFLLYIMMSPYFNQMNVMRESLSISVSLFAFLIIITKKEISALLISIALVFFAGTLHSTANLFFPVLLFFFYFYHTKKKPTTNGLFVFFLIMSIILFIFYFHLVPFMEKIISERYFGYTNDNAWADSNYNASLFNTLVSFFFLSLGSCYYQKREITNLDFFAFFMSGIAMITCCLSMRMEIWTRVSSFFSFFLYILFVPAFSSLPDKPSQRCLLKTTIIFFCFVYMVVVLTFRPEWTKVVPYSFRDFSSFIGM